MDVDALRKRLCVEEGRRSRVYNDTLGIPTIGVGFNLQRLDARAQLAAIGADYDAVLAGRQELTDDQIDRLLDLTIGEAVSAARGLVDDYDTIPPDKQLVLVDMVFNMGVARLRGFTNMLAAVRAQDWKRAAAEMQDSLWYRQVGQRAVELCAQMGATPGDPTIGVA